MIMRMSRTLLTIPMRSRQEPPGEINNDGPPVNAGSFVSEGVYDVCIVGAGVAGLSAGIFAARRGLSTMIVSPEVGGQTASTAEIENYPGLGQVEGDDLMKLFAEEARRYGCSFATDRIETIIADDSLIVRGAHSSLSCRALVIATGKSQRKLNVPGEEELFDRGGVSYAGSLDAESFRGARVAVVGGGNSALSAATRLAPFAKGIFIIHRRDQLSGERVLQDRLARAKNITVLANTVVRAIEGDEYVSAIRIITSGEEESLNVDRVIIAVGFEVSARWFSGIVDCTEDGRIRIDDACRTSRDGIFSAGDCTTVPFQQIVISAGEGAKAALSAYRYLQAKSGGRSLAVDWGYTKTKN